MLNKIRKQQKGFTIIEVLIVLAIAGLILLIVFLAVPALQRNSRNTQRRADASRIAGAVNECGSNNSGNIANCLTGGQLSPAYVNLANNQQLATIGAAGVTSAAVANNTQCNGNTPAPGGGARAFTVAYQVETSGGTLPQCVSS